MTSFQRRDHPACKAQQASEALICLSYIRSDDEDFKDRLGLNKTRPPESLTGPPQALPPTLQDPGTN